MTSVGSRIAPANGRDDGEAGSILLPVPAPLFSSVCVSVCLWVCVSVCMCACVTVNFGPLLLTYSFWRGHAVRPVR